MADSKQKSLAPAARSPVHKRAARRRRLDGKKIALYIAGERKTFELSDISTFGCRIVCDGAEVAKGEFLHLADGASGPIPAIVRWVVDGLAGLEFSRTVSESELAELAG